MIKKVLNRKSKRRIKQSSTIVYGYKVYCKTTGLFYCGKTLEYDAVGKLYTNLGDCRKAVNFQRKECKDAELFIVKLTYKLNEIEILEK